MTCGIYAIINTKNNKCYFGSSKNMESRLRNHFLRLSRGTHENSRFQRAYNSAQDKNVFVSTHFLVCEEGVLLQMEQLCFDIFNPSYNIAKIAGKPPAYTGEQNGFYGKKHKESAKRIMSVAQSERQRKPEDYDVQRQLFKGEGNPFYGKTHTRETKEKIYGKNHYTKKPGYVHHTKKDDYTPPSQREGYVPRKKPHSEETKAKTSGANHYTKKEGYVPRNQREGYVRPSEKPDYDPTPRLRSPELRARTSGENHYTKKPGYVHHTKKPGYVRKSQKDSNNV